MIGLGGSQKAEVAWMDKMGFEYEEHDVEEFFADLSESGLETVGEFVKKHQAPKKKAKLKKVLRESKLMLDGRVAEGTAIAVTSFRKGGVNAEHAFLHQVQACLLETPPSLRRVGYVHYQSGFENTLFDWKSGSDECDYGVDKYYVLGMKRHWYIEWLEIVAQCSKGRGYLIIFDLSGDAAMNTSINCAMELGLLYRLYAINNGFKLIVLNDQDVILDDSEKLATLIRRKAADQDAQATLFKAAYDKCYAFLQSYFAATHGLATISSKWTHDYELAGGTFGESDTVCRWIKSETKGNWRRSVETANSMFEEEEFFARTGSNFSAENPMFEEIFARKDSKLNLDNPLASNGGNVEGRADSHASKIAARGSEGSISFVDNPMGAARARQEEIGNVEQLQTTKVATPTAPLRRILQFKKDAERTAMKSEGARG
jgi:hypothetical protein